MELIIIIRSLGAIYAVLANLLLALFVIFIYTPFFAKNKHNRTSFNKPVTRFSFFLLAFFGITYVAIGVQTILGFFVYVVIPLLLYIAGWMIASADLMPALKTKKIIYATMVGNGIHALLNLLINLGHARGSNVDFFTQTLASDTISGSINIIILSSVICIFVEKNKFLRIVNIILIAISLLYALQLATRSTFLITVIVFLISFILKTIEEKKFKNLIKFIVALSFLGVLFFAMYNYNLFSIRSFIEHSNMMERLSSGIGSSNSTRYERFFDGITNLFKYPMGSADISAYYHNTWLDVARISGIIPFIFYSLFTVVSIAHVLEVYRNKSIPFSCRILFFAVYLGIYLNLFVEPGMEGFIELIYEFVLINGMVDYLSNKANKKTYLLPSRTKTDSGFINNFVGI